MIRGYRVTLALAAGLLLAVLGAAPTPGPGGAPAAAGGGNITFIGYGKGHGVGMCMAGVYYRALRGEEYHNIIRAYYTGVGFSRVSDDTVIRVKCRDGVVRPYTLREYLYRLQEEPDTWPAQGLRVLVVAARTYVLSCIARGKHAADGYDICPYGSCCQAFNEQIDPATRPNIVAAVNATAGEIITYNGQPIIAAYDTCCGGYTAGPEEAWGGSPVPYLRPVPDDACAPDEDHDWRVTMSWEELQNRLNSRSETAVGILYGVEVVSRWTSGRVKEIRVFGSGGSKTVSGRLFASIVGLQTHFFYIASQNFDEYLLLQNPGEESAECLVTYMLSGGGTLQEECIVEPHSRLTLKVNERVQNAEVSVKVTSNVPVVAERAMYFDFLGIGRKGGHASLGLTEPRSRWYFAEGFTAGAFDTFFLVQNPDSTSPAHLTVSFLGQGGEVDQLYYTVAPSSRMTIWMDQEPGLDQGEFTAELESDVPVVAERAVYFGYRDLAGGSVAEGAPDPHTRWYFAEGYTGGAFDSWILLANPNPDAVTARLTFFLPDGSTREREVSLAPRSRTTISVDALEGMENREFSALVEAGAPVVAERAMYFNYRGRRGGHDSMGIRELSRTWYFAEGYTGGDFDTWLLLANPNQGAVKATLTFMRVDGSRVEREVELPPRSRLTVHVDEIPGLEDSEFSIRVTALGEIAAERAMYFSYQGRDGGSCSQGAAGPALEWYFAEGYTGS
ncbi:SpoIID/LytB domain-containing protein [Candidatus Solincola tengchongensis]|uniref:SpoIID/LytB domain-containing protein n=1 Tax=Candidatus Solincola tengchongensis TaxID=2900693 RepID=UPI00257C3E64|nr:SpoIID/LytB domain-containing protein [Candidatus Solincola tengchongensis]